MGKVMPLTSLAETVASLKASGKTIVFTNGCFDILHAGHVTYLAEARRLGDVLIIGLNSDASVRTLKGWSRPIVTQEERATVLAALNAVDYVIVFDEPTPYSLIEAIHPHVLVKGGDWSTESVVGRDIVERDGGRVVIIPYVPNRSTTNIIEKIRESFNDDK